ncbi:MAG: holo-[acyl-carrier protein] synthase [Chloroflexia bacterium]|jgi:holo-[acyl-carrier protein] synthase|nr:holo-[acyl-carrier protein] synthase [Chloroflexia bacterium]
MADEFTSPSSLAGLSPLAAGAGLSVSDAMDGRIQCGVDLIEISRIEAALDRWGERFLRRVWTEREIAACRGRHRELAARFAAKEAASKALGTGIVGIIWRELEVLSDRRGKPLLFLHGQARARAEELGLNTWAVSLTHSRDMACAFVVAYAAHSR